MAARALVKSDIDLGERLLNALDEAGIPIEVSYWMLSPEWGDWWLVLGTPIYDEQPTPSAMQQIVDVRRSLEDSDYLMGKLGVVGVDDLFVRALRKRLRDQLPRPGYHLGHFYAEDLEVEDSYAYRLVPRSESAANGNKPKYRRVSNGTTTARKAPVETGA
jgi:hypothetical protein